MAFLYLPAFFITLFLSVFLAPLVRRGALRYNFVAKPKKDRWNRRVIPLCGGIGIFISFIVSFLLYGRKNPFFLPIIGGSTAIFFCGLIDDIFSIKPYSKLFVQIIVSLFIYLSGVRFTILPVPFMNFFLTIFWFVAIMNAFNLLDNMDGLCAGIAAISAGIIFAYYGFYGDSDAAMPALLLGASALGFLRYNFNPAKLFMGDCGSMFIGFIMAAVSVISTWKGASNFLFTLVIPVLVLAVPLFDTILVTFTRQASGRHFYEGGKDHISHRLVVLGMSERRAVLTLYFMSLACGFLVFMYTKLNVAIGIIFAASLLLLLLFFGVFLSQVKIYRPDDAVKTGGLKAGISLGGMIYYKQSLFEMTVDFVIISISYIAAYLLRYEGILSQGDVMLIIQSLPILIMIKLCCFYWFGLYKVVWPYISFHDLLSIFKAVTSGSVISMAVLAFMFRLRGYSMAVFVIDWLMLLMSACGVRLMLRALKEYFDSLRQSGKKMLIFGAGDAGEYLARRLKSKKSLNYAPVGFIDDNPQKQGRKIHGLSILGTREDISKLARKYDAVGIIVAVPSLDEDSFTDIKNICGKNGIECTKMSDLSLW